MTTTTRKSLLVIVPVIAGVAVLAIAELLLRMFAPLHLVGIQRAYQYDEELGYRLAPGVNRTELTDHLEEIRTNALGTVNFQEDFAPYETLVFAVGDSFTQGTGLPSDAAYPFQLDLLLNQDDDGNYRPRFGIVNLGLAAFGTEQSLIALRRYADIVGKPRFILYLGSDNDWEDDVLLRSGYRHRHLVQGSPTWGVLVGPLQWLNRLELAKRAKFALSELRRSAAVQEAGRGGASEPSVAERVWPALEKIVALAQAWDAVIIVGWANPDTPSYRWLQQRAAERGIAFADWARAADSVRQAMPALPLGNPHSGGHWRPWANQVIARSYAREMRSAMPAADAAN